jgi:hypothetical protein
MESTWYFFFKSQTFSLPPLSFILPIFLLLHMAEPFIPSTQHPFLQFSPFPSLLCFFLLCELLANAPLLLSVHWCPGAICLYLSSPAIKIGQVWSRSDTCGGGRFKARFLMDFSRHGPTIYTAPADGVSVLGVV